MINDVDGPLQNPELTLIEERRKDQRFALNCALTIRSLTQRSTWQIATLQDISAGGILIKAHERYAEKDAVEISLQDAIFLGELVHLRQAGQDFLMGVKLSHRLMQRDLVRALRDWV
jgi:PilZ domain